MLIVVEVVTFVVVVAVAEFVHGLALARQRPPARVQTRSGHTVLAGKAPHVAVVRLVVAWGGAQPSQSLQTLSAVIVVVSSHRHHHYHHQRRYEHDVKHRADVRRNVFVEKTKGSVLRGVMNSCVGVTGEGYYICRR